MNATVISLRELRADPSRFAWFDFKPGVKKRLLSGAAESRHVGMLWYGYDGTPGRVPIHQHHQTESIFVISGAQSDAKGRYGTGSFYFNPPGSRHEVFDSAGLFLLSYAAPPDFSHAAPCATYENVVVGADYRQLPLAACGDGSLRHQLALASNGGMRASFVQPRAARVVLEANVLLVLQGACTIRGTSIATDTLLVTQSMQPSSYDVTGDCLLYAMAFE